MKSREIITSKENQHLVAARRVRDGKDTEHIFFEGRRLATEVLRSNVTLEQCLISDAFADEALISQLTRATDECYFVADKLFRSIADTDSSQGIVLITNRPKNSMGAAEPTSLYLYLHEINNPSNLGAIFRTAEAANIAGILISKNSADPFSAKSNRASMGSNLRIPVLEAAGSDELLSWARENDLITTAAAVSTATSYSDIDWKKGRVLVYGSEAHGLDESFLETLDETFIIPMENGVESLNLGVSVGITLFEAKRQREVG